MSAISILTEPEYYCVGVEIIDYTSVEDCQDAFNDFAQEYETNPEFITEQYNLGSRLMIIASNMQTDNIQKIIEYDTMRIILSTWSENYN
jgi:hypothetical protein